MSNRGGKVPVGDMPRDATPPKGGSKPDAASPGLRDVVAEALEVALDKAYDTSSYRWPRQEDIPPMADAVLAALQPHLAQARAEGAAEALTAQWWTLAAMLVSNGGEIRVPFPAVIPDACVIEAFIEAGTGDRIIRLRARGDAATEETP